MAVILSNTQIDDVVNEAYKLSTGITGTDGDPLDLTNIIDGGDSNPKLGDIKDQFTKSLIAVLTKRRFTQTSYRSEYKDPFYVDEQEFRLIMESITVTAPEVQKNPAWANFVSGQSQIGVYTVFLPIVDTQYYTKTTSWSLPITISWEQWNTAFYDREELNNFVNYILMVVDNAILQHRENMNNMNRNNAMMERLLSDNGTCAINLVENYSKEVKGDVALSVDDVLNDQYFYVYTIEVIEGIVELFKKQTNIFNATSTTRFTPKERLVVQMLSKFISRMNGMARSNIFHNDLLKLPMYDTVPFWQNVGDGTFKDLSTLSVKNGENYITQSGIVGFIADKWGIMHTIKKQRVASQFFDIENVTQYSYQFVDQYLNDLSQNGVVLYVQDYKI